MSSQDQFCGNSLLSSQLCRLYITHLHDETQYAMIKHNVKLDISD